MKASPWLGMQLDRMFRYKMQASTKFWDREELAALNDMAAKGIEHDHLFPLYQAVISSVTE